MESRTRPFFPHSVTFFPNDPTHSQFSWQHKSLDYEDDPSLLYRYDDQVLEIRLRKRCEHEVITQLHASDLSSEVNDEVNIGFVASCVFKRLPFFVIVTYTDDMTVFLFWHNVLKKETSVIRDETPLKGPFSCMALSRLPFVAVKQSWRELRNGSNLRHLLVFGQKDGSLVVCILDLTDSQSNIHAKHILVSMPSTITGQVTAIDILTQDARERRRGCSDPRIAVGSSQGQVQLFRVKVRPAEEIQVIPAQDLNNYVQFPDTPISFISCLRIPKQRTIVLAFGQNGSHNTESGQGLTDTYIQLMEFYGNWRRKVIGPLVSSLSGEDKTILRVARIIPAKLSMDTDVPTCNEYQVIGVFQSDNDEHTVTFDAWSIQKHRAARIASLKMPDEPIHDAWPLRGALGYLLLYPQKLIEFKVPGAGELTPSPSSSMFSEVGDDKATFTSDLTLSVNDVLDGPLTDEESGSWPISASDDAVSLDDVPRSAAKRSFGAQLDLDATASTSTTTTMPLATPASGALPGDLGNLTMETNSTKRQKRATINGSSPSMQAADHAKDQLQEWARQDIQRAWDYQRNNAKDTSPLSRNECLDIILETLLTNDATMEDLEALSSQSLDVHEYQYMAEYCWQCSRPVCKLFMMHCTIQHDKFADTILLNDLIQSDPHLPQDMKTKCSTLADMARHMLPSNLAGLSLDVFGQSQGQPGNPFLPKSSTPNVFRQHGLRAGARFMCDMLKAKESRIKDGNDEKDKMEV